MKRTQPSRVALLFLVPAVIGGCSGKASNSTSGSAEPTAAAKKSLVVLTFGGEFAAAQRKAYFDPFEKETGVKIVTASYDGEYGKLKAAVQSGAVQWDVVDIESPTLMRGKGESLFEPIDYAVVDKTDLIPSGVDPYAVATDFYSLSLGYNSTKYKGATPKTWKDFWDLQKFPGPRTMQKDPKGTLEIALLADGVPASEVYAGGKLDVDRALKKLDKIRSAVKVWWASGQQPIQLLADGEVSQAAAYGARMWDAQHKEARPIVVTWDQGILDIEYWAVLKGAANKDLAMKFMDFCSKPERQAAFCKEIPLGPVNKKAFNFLPAAMAKDLNTSSGNYSKQVLLNSVWWAQNEAKVTDRWTAWLSRR